MMTELRENKYGGRQLREVDYKPTSAGGSWEIEYPVKILSEPYPERCLNMGRLAKQTQKFYMCRHYLLVDENTQEIGAS